jgi:pimeloyl-ACP methyl ester carboxylesterase
MIVYSNRHVKNDHLSIIVVLSTLIVLSSSISNYGYYNVANIVYGQIDPGQANSTNTTGLVNIQDIPLKKVHVGDIDIAYKMFGKGDPILLISPAQGDMNAWKPSTLSELSSNHTVTVFDNRGVGNTTAGTKPFSIQQFANDTVGLMDALKIQKAGVLGYSLGSFVAQQLSVTHPEKVNRLILIASSCGGKEGIHLSPEIDVALKGFLKKISNDTPFTRQEVKEIMSVGMGSGWLKLHPNFFETISIPEFTQPKDFFHSITPDNNLKQAKATEEWRATNWNGVCNEITKLSVPTLIMTGTDDITVPALNSLVIAEKIPGAWLIQFKNAGHSLPEQYPDEINKILQTFLSTIK